MIKNVSELYGLDDAAFNRAVAELAGWRVSGDRLRGWTMTSPTGSKWAVRPGKIEWDMQVLPDYATDLNAAWALWKGEKARLVIEIDAIEDPDPIVGVAVYGSPYAKRKVCWDASLSPSRAIATAWAEWKLR